MPRDARLYMTFPNDFHRHPKITRLSVEARWTFVEMNGEARLADNDGRFTAEEAEYLWSADILAELVRSHPSRPVVARDGTDYVIRDYAEHQQTKADREDLHRKRVEAGRKGGLSKGQASAKPMASESKPSEAESESEDYLSPLQRQSSSNRASVSTDPIYISKTTARLASQQGVSLRPIVDAVQRECGITLNADQALQLSIHILGKSRGTVPNPQAYVVGSVTKNPHEIQKHIYESMAVAS